MSDEKQLQEQENAAGEVDTMTDTVRVSVRELVEFILQSGDIDNRISSGAQKDAMQMGSRFHRKIQGRMGGDYRSEVGLSGVFPCEDFQILVEGRADGIFTEDGITVIDEIKGVFRELSRMDEPVPVHLAQAKCYAFLYGLDDEAALEDEDEIKVRMSYGNLETEEMKYFRFTYLYKELKLWFADLMQEYRKWAIWRRAHLEKRSTSIRDMQFPFPYREGQRDLAGDVYRTIRREKTLFIQAPTGTGKTITTMFPTLKAMGEGMGDKLFYLTARTIVRTVAMETLELLRAQNLSVKSVVITAKEKMCINHHAVGECNPDDCPYARGHFDRINDALYRLLNKEDAFSAETIQTAAMIERVCPYELCLDLCSWSDVIIGDYNYVFGPRTRLRRFFGDGVKGDYLYLIDEAHNLVDRGRDMYSAALVKEELLALKKEIKPFHAKMARAIERCNRQLLAMKKECTTYRVVEGVGTFAIALTNLYGIMEDYLEDRERRMEGGEVRARVLEMYFQIGAFLEVCDLLDDHYVVYHQIREDGSFRICLYCVDPSVRLQECLDKARSSVFFSATLLPITYYKKLLSTREDNYAIYASSAFDRTHWQVLIGRDTSSRYTRRNEGEYRRIAGYIQEAIRQKKGNYLVFFPSYKMMEDVAGIFEADIDADTELLLQTSHMSEEERESFLSAFEEERENSLAAFCVMGSIFSEGIDLREDRLIGSIIVGPGIPQVGPEREILKNYYDHRGMDGFRFAYQYPGMNKVLQAAGRVIRTESDRGIILLLDERFARNDYRELFPREWAGRLSLCTRESARQAIEAFWKEKS